MLLIELLSIELLSTYNWLDKIVGICSGSVAQRFSVPMPGHTLPVLTPFSVIRGGWAGQVAGAE